MKTKIIIGSDEDVKDFPRKTLLRNAIRCKQCGDEIESKHHHHYVKCSCQRVAIDGGLHYTRSLGELEDIEFLYEWLVEIVDNKEID